MKKFFPAFVFLSIIALLPSYTRIAAPADAHSTLSHSSNQFAFALMHATLSDDSTNRLISPVGVYLSLSLLYNGANKATKDSLAHVLQVSDMDINQLNALSKSLLQQVSLADKKAHFSMANSIWCNRKKLRLVPSFGELGENYYYSNVQALPFNGHATAEKVNRWTTQNTDRQFPAILQNANPNDMLYLTNACCFSSSWQHPFDSANTQMDFFYPTGGHRMIAPFMRKLEVMKAYTDTSFTMVELPYGDFSAFSLYIVLPNDLQQTLRQFIASFQEKKLYDAIARMNDQWVDLSLPKWEHSSDTGDMRQALRQMGLGILFNETGQSNLSNMCTKPGRSNLMSTWDLVRGIDETEIRQSTPISKFYHRAAFSINEKGTMTEATTTPDTEMPQSGRRNLSITADHPFLYFVVAKQQQVVLLTGVMNAPLAADIPTKPHAVSPSRTGGLHLPHGTGHRPSRTGL